MQASMWMAIHDDTPPNTLQRRCALRFACDRSVVASQRSFITVNEEEIKQLNRSHRLHINTHHVHAYPFIIQLVFVHALGGGAHE